MGTDHFSEQDQHFMRRALELAKRGWGLTNPNPLVGCVLVRNGNIVSEGWHARFGGDHAEAMALKQLENAEGTTLYVNLEPCNHIGKTPPCSELIIRKGVGRVIYALDDPNPVAGGGASRLREAGIQVSGGLLQAEAAQLNEIFIHTMRVKRPFVIMKYAMTLDGKIATSAGDSRWITGPQARVLVHGLRQRTSAILVGSGSVLADDPELSVRDWEGEKRQPLRVILDARGRIPLEARVFHNQETQQTLLATTEQLSRDKVGKLMEQGVQIWRCPRGNGQIDLTMLMDELRNRGCDSVLVEGGAEVHGSFFDNRLVDRVYAFVAPKLVGGKDAPGPVGGRGKERMAQAVELMECRVEKLGQDILFTGIPKFGEEA